VVAYDWKKFLRERLDTYGPGAPLNGITNGGWKLVYTDQRGELGKATEKTRKTVDARFSLGLTLDEKGVVSDVIMNSPAWNAGIAPGVTLVAVNGRRFTPDILREALQDSKRNGQNLELLIANGDFFRTYTPNYHDGEKYPHLVRDESKADLLGEIIKAMK
jgi:predicted metalloprotease with PDZ domain